MMFSNVNTMVPYAHSPPRFVQSLEPAWEVDREKDAIGVAQAMDVGHTRRLTPLPMVFKHAQTERNYCCNN